MAGPNPPATHVEAEPDSRLSQLLAEYPVAKANADEAAERFDTVKTAIKAELAAAAPDSARIAATDPQLGASLLMRWVESWRLDSKRLKAEQPVTWVTYAKKAGHWELRADG